MSLGEKGLRKKAKRLEVESLKTNKINSELISSFVELLRDVYVISRPKEKDYYNRNDLVRIFNEIAKEIYGTSGVCPLVEPFGSFLMDLFSNKSDLDLSVNLGENAVELPREEKIKALRKFAKKLFALQKKGHVSGIQPIFFAKVPILKVIDCGTGIECDISIENRDGVVKSKIINHICSIDSRFQMLSFLTKVWANAHGINSSKDRTLNSLSIISLVAFHLQTRNPPILPPFAALLKDGPDPSRVAKLVTRFTEYGKRNKESLGELFVTLLIKLASAETLWPKGLCASVYDGAWTLKTWEYKYGVMSVEDFTDRSENVARAVGSGEVKRIYKCIHFSLHYISAFMNGKIDSTKLGEILFGQEGGAVGKRRSANSNDFNKSKKKMRTNEYLEGIMRQPVPFIDVLKKVVSINTTSQGVLKQTPTIGWPSGNSHVKKQNSISGRSIRSRTNQENLGGANAIIIPSFISQLVNGSKAT